MQIVLASGEWVVSVEVTNTGHQHAGREVAHIHIYVGFLEEVDTS